MRPYSLAAPGQQGSRSAGRRRRREKEHAEQRRRRNRFIVRNLDNFAGEGGVIEVVPATNSTQFLQVSLVTAEAQSLQLQINSNRVAWRLPLWTAIEDNN